MTNESGDDLKARQAGDVDRLLDHDWAEVLAAVARGEIEDGIMPGLDDDRRVRHCAGDTLIAAKLEIERLQADLERADAVVLAFMEAGGASPRQGIVRIGTWSLDKLAKAFDLARSFIASRSKEPGDE